ncbi:hypothetical protein BEP19_07480 [Ammoniphilus oxalaticus]|uniref:HD-GYP domain-containing protein n=1 Tax=Ammoniphilus oxalaticus TaxID=66863 RepID=A0A419SJT0_9BACL|nr:HD-GYP domain-containing protein [Ammoniphilus oxalaticus]RKD24237.1 hypothetical protein BEP19_07480 [Ammoniphilus oxalaticus]
MRIVATDQCLPGTILAKPIYNSDGIKLIGAGTELTKAMIERLKLLGISIIYARDELSEGIEVVDAVPLKTRIEAMQVIRSVFSSIQESSRQGSKRFSSQVKVNDLTRVFENLITVIKDSNQTMSLLSEIHDKESHVFSHSINVTIYSIALGIRLGFNDGQIKEIGIGALLHDIGKMQIPSTILHKPGRLTNDEFFEIQKHPAFGFDLLKKQYEISYLSAHCAFQHHERWDGTGYPRGLKGKEIHPYARLMAVCDVYDAMTTQRVYRKALLPNESMNWIQSQSSILFEEKMVDAFRQTIAPFPIGLTVRLNTGETAIVSEPHPDAPDRPVVRIIKEPNGETLIQWREIDLNQYPELEIVETHSLI